MIEAYAALHLQDDFGRAIEAADHHRLWLRLACDERIKRLLIIAPPESAKTTWLISAFTGAYLGFWPERSVIIGSVSGEVAEKRSMSLRAMVEGDAWRATFPGVETVKAADGLKYNTNEWSLAPNGEPFKGRIHPSVFAVGRGGAIIGARADLLISDDFLNDESANSPRQRETGERWIYNSFLSRAKSKTGRTVMIGNAWNPEDFYSKMLREQRGFVICKMATLSDRDDGYYATLTYPDDWPYEVIGERTGQAVV